MQSKYFPFEIILHTRLSFPSEMVVGKLEVFVEFNIFSRHSFKNDVVFEEIIFRKMVVTYQFFWKASQSQISFCVVVDLAYLKNHEAFGIAIGTMAETPLVRFPEKKHPFCHFSFSHVPQLTFGWVGFWLGWESDSRPPRSSSLLHVETNRWFETWLDSWPAIYQICIFKMVQRC